jgi:hypothetical protein
MKRTLFIIISIILILMMNEVTAKNYFVENKGQWNQDVLYATRIKGMNAWIKKDGLTFDFYKNTQREEQDFRTGHVVAMKLLNTNTTVYPKPIHPLQGYHNYFIGNNPSNWQSHVSLFEEVIVEEVYPGIAIRYYFENGFMRYDFIIQAGADPGQIAIKVDGCHSRLNNIENTLVFDTQLGEIKQKDLFTYQYIEGRKNELKSFFSMHDGVISIHVEDYHTNAKIIIDPVIFSTFIGGQAFDNLWDMKRDKNGNWVFCGTSPGFGYPITTGAYSTEVEGNSDDAFLSKLSADGSQMIFSTFFGGNMQELCQGLAIDNNDNILIVGSTSSDNLPITVGALNETLNLGGTSQESDVFVSKFNSAGASLIYSTYLGGTETELGRSIAVDQEGNAYITGLTSSFLFPTTAGAFSSNYSGQVDAFVSKINASGTQLLYSTYVGGNSNEEVRKIVVRTDGSAFVIGTTFSSNFPTTTGAIQTFRSGIRDAFVFRLNQTGSGMIYSTFVGGNELEDGNAISVDEQNNAYITGFTRSDNFPVTANVFNGSFGGGEDAFISKINPNGTAFLFSALLSGNSRDIGHAISLGSDNTILITGETNSNNFQITPNAHSLEPFGLNDVFIAKISLDGSNLIYNTYFGGNSAEIGYAIFDEGPDKLIVGGVTNSQNFPSTSGAFDNTHNGFTDAFISKISLICQPPGFSATSNSPICVGADLVLSGFPSGMVSYTWSGPGNYSVTNQNTTISNVNTNNSGQYTFTAVDNDGCEGSIVLNIEVVEIDLLVVQDETSLVAQQADAQYQWLDCNDNFNAIAGAQAQFFTFGGSGSFAVEISLQGCKDTTACLAITGFKEILTKSNLFYPNPAKDFINFKSLNGFGLLKLYDLNGRLLKNTSINESLTLDISDVAPGLYVIQVLTSDNQLIHSKLIINH